MMKAPIAAFAKRSVGVAGPGGPHIDPMPIGLDFLERYDGKGSCARHVVTLRAKREIQSVAPIYRSRIGPIWRHRRFSSAQKGSDPTQRGLRLLIEFLRRHSVTQSR